MARVAIQQADISDVGELFTFVVDLKASCG
jgi:hypothetical protein